MDNNEHDYVDWDIDDSDMCDGYTLCGGYTLYDDDIFDGEDTKFCCTEKFYALREQAEQGDANAQFQVGEYCQYDYDLTEAVKWYRKAAEQGHVYAQCALGLLYEIWGANKDEVEAVKWYRKAAEQGHADAQLSLGNCYHFGRGVDKDDAEAEKWYLKAIEQGNSLAERVFEVFNNLRSKS